MKEAMTLEQMQDLIECLCTVAIMESGPPKNINEALAYEEHIGIALRENAKDLYKLGLQHQIKSAELRLDILKSYLEQD